MTLSNMFHDCASFERPISRRDVCLLIPASYTPLAQGSLGTQNRSPSSPGSRSFKLPRNAPDAPNRPGESLRPDRAGTI